MLDSIIEKLGSVLSEDELDFMIYKLANPETTWVAGSGPLEGAKGPDADKVPRPARFKGSNPPPPREAPEHSVAEPTPDPSGEHVDDAAPTQGSAPSGSPSPSPGDNKGPTNSPPNKPGRVDRAMDWLSEKTDTGLDALGRGGEYALEQGKRGVDAVLDLDHEALGGIVHETAMASGGAVRGALPDKLTARLSPSSKATLDGLIGYGIPAGTAVALLYAMLSDKKKKKDSEGLPPGLAKLQAAKDLDVYIWAYLRDNGVIN